MPVPDPVATNGRIPRGGPFRNYERPDTVTFFLTAPFKPAVHLAGDFNGWNAAGNAMNDLGGGIWSVDLTGVGGRHEFKVTIGDWSQNWPGSGNSWFLGDGSGNVTLSFNANDIQGIAAEIVLADPQVDAVLVILTPQAMTNPTGAAKSIAELAAAARKPILAAWAQDPQARTAPAITAV